MEASFWNNGSAAGGTSRVGVAAAVALIFGAGAVLAGDPPPEYAGYNQMQGWDNTSKHSWNQAGNWWNGWQGNTNYCVRSGAQLLKPTWASSNWAGGQLAVAGYLKISSTSHDGAPIIADLVLLPGGQVLADNYGPFSSLGGTTLTVLGTAETPSKISWQKTCSDGMNAYYQPKMSVKGGADAVLVFERPHADINGAPCYDYLSGTLFNGTFDDYAGTAIFRGDYTRLSFLPRMDIPNGTIKIEQQAYVELSSNTFGDDAARMPVRSFLVPDGRVLVRRTGETFYPRIDASGSFHVGKDATMQLGGLTAKDVRGVRKGETRHLYGPIARLSGAAVADWSYDCDLIPYAPPLVLRLYAVDNGDGTTDLRPGTEAVTMDVANIETTGSAGTQYGAFESGHADCWSNGETPSEDSTLDYVTTAKLCCFQNIYMPKATLTYGAGSTWKNGNSICFREIHLLPGVTISSWSGPALRWVQADRINVHGDPTQDAHACGWCMYPGKSLNINSTLHGDGHFRLSCGEGAGASDVEEIGIGADNSNFHGRFSVVGQASSPYGFRLRVSDSRMFGDSYSRAEADGFRAISLVAFPRLQVLFDDVELADPTRGLLVDGGAAFEVAEGKTLRLANAVTMSGTIVKDGQGELDLGGTLRFYDSGLKQPVATPTSGKNALVVEQGSVRVSGVGSVNGLAMTFAAGTRLVLDAAVARSATGILMTACGNPLASTAADGKIALSIVPPAESVAAKTGFTSGICTMTAEAAKAVDFKCGKVPGYIVNLGRRSNDDGTVTFFAACDPKGMAILVK